jgi:hypothetical protein
VRGAIPRSNGKWIFFDEKRSAIDRPLEEG